MPLGISTHLYFIRAQQWLMPFTFNLTCPSIKIFYDFFELKNILYLPYIFQSIRLLKLKSHPNMVLLCTEMEEKLNALLRSLKCLFPIKSMPVSTSLIQRYWTELKWVCVLWNITDLTCLNTQAKADVNWKGSVSNHGKGFSTVCIWSWRYCEIVIYSDGKTAVL